MLLPTCIKKPLYTTNGQIVLYSAVTCPSLVHRVWSYSGGDTSNNVGEINMLGGHRVLLAVCLLDVLMIAGAAQNYDSKLLHHEIPEGPFSYNSDHFISTGGQCRVGLDDAFDMTFAEIAERHSLALRTMSDLAMFTDCI